MPNYRRARAPGGTFFFTVVSWRRRSILCHPAIRASLRVAISNVREVHPFIIDAWVLLPDHLHCVWTLPEGDMDFSVRWSNIKRFVTQRVEGSVIDAHGAPYGLVTRSRRREGCIWQRRFWEHQVRDQLDMARCLDYLHWNPVKHGHARAVVEWSYSSFHRYARQGHYPEGWGGPVNEGQGVFGE